MNLYYNLEEKLNLCGASNRGWIPTNKSFLEILWMITVTVDLFVSLRNSICLIKHNKQIDGQKEEHTCETHNRKWK